jgi:hypothetical protein
MKQIIIYLLIALAINCVASAQTSDSLKASIDKQYFGLLNTAAFNPNKNDAGTPTYATDLRIGLQAKVTYEDYAGFIRGAYTPTKVIAATWLEKYCGPVTLAVGLMPRLLAAVRPNPISAGGQFEMAALGVIPAVTTGFMGRYTAGSLKFEAGVYDQLGHPEINAAIAGDNFRLGAFYSTWNYGSAGQIIAGPFKATYFWSSDSLSSCGLNLTTGPLCWYGSMIFNHETRQFRNNLEFGLGSQDFQLDYNIKTSVWLGYAPKQKMVNFYVFIYVD